MDFLNEFTKEEIIAWMQQDVRLYFNPPKKSELLFSSLAKEVERA